MSWNVLTNVNELIPINIPCLDWCRIHNPIIDFTQSVWGDFYGQKINSFQKLNNSRDGRYAHDQFSRLISRIDLGESW